MTGKTCRICEEWKSLDQFHRRPDSRGYVRTECKQCKTDSVKARFNRTHYAYEYCHGFELTPTTLREILTFDPAINRFRWLVDHPSGRAKAGSVAGGGDGRITINKQMYQHCDVVALWRALDGNLATK